jgi:hypothetical protein
MLSEAVQEYLKAIYKLSRAPETGAMVSTTLIAERMSMSAASATNMVKKLAEMRLLEHRPYQGPFSMGAHAGGSTWRDLPTDDTRLYDRLWDCLAQFRGGACHRFGLCAGEYSPWRTVGDRLCCS